MNRRLLSTLIVLVAAASLGATLASCNTPSCGPGTVQKQQANGELKCVPVDAQVGTTPCATDGGTVVIVGGQCVSAIQCDPGTTMNENGICVGTGGGGPATCTTPMPGKACVYGTINDFKSGAANTVTPLSVELYDAFGLLNGQPAIASTTLTMSGAAAGSYVFKDFTPPGFGIIIVITGRTNTGVMTPAGTGAQGVVGDQIYRVDAYSLKQTDSSAWGFDIATGGAYVGKFYTDTKPDPKLLIANESKPAAGVTMTKDGSSTGVKYFDGTLTAIDNTLTVTGTSGVGIVAAPVPMGSAVFPMFTGMGGGISAWETLPGGSAPGLVVITRFHPN
jgi:hypothetical protein